VEINEANESSEGATSPVASRSLQKAHPSPANTIPTREDVILVDARNRAIGRGEKWQVHAAGLLHRAFSIFLVDRRGRLLLQRRSRSKYHSGGLWANSCCGHPRPGERTGRAAVRRLAEELGATAPLRFAFRARYRTDLPNGLTENEIVYVFFGPAPASFGPNPDEVSELSWMTLAELQRDIAAHPRRYAYWLRYYMKNHYAAIRRGLAAARGIAQA
jgi:isopentenyl-diphosphate delta-isomerase